jgi:hypothetical protein
MTNPKPTAADKKMARSINKRLRFEIFKRDGFCCRYCGATPMTTVLQVDHVIPVSKGGTADPANLVTSCSACNAGKSNVELNDARLPRSFDVEIIREHAEQTRAYLTAQTELAVAQAAPGQAAIAHWGRVAGERLLPSEAAQMRMFCRELALSVVLEAIDVAVAKKDFVDDTWRYFCGICYRRLRGEFSNA